MNLRGVLISATTRMILEENGRSDAEHGIDKEVGWKEVAEICDFYPYGRTPAHEAYLDGYYSYVKP